MLNAQTIAENYIAFWNAPEAAERQRRFQAGWRPDARYADPVMRGAGGDEICGLAAAAQQRFPGFAFRLIGPASGHGEFVRFRWALGPAGAEAPVEGSDVVRIDDGRIAEVIGFLDKLPE